MQKLNIAQAAEHFNISKEAIHNRIRRGTLNCIIESGIKYVVINNADQTTTQPNTPSRDTSVIDDKYYNYIEEENLYLKEKILKLENETKSLRDQKEQMLIEERNKIEKIYKERDDQLKNVLNVVANKFLAHINTDTLMKTAIHNDENDALLHEDVDTVEEAVVVEMNHEMIPLKTFLKLKNYSDKKRNKLKKRFQDYAKSDKRLHRDGKKIYLQPTKYDYTDLLN